MTPNACALDVIESLHEVCSAADDVDDVLRFPRKVWFRRSCIFTRSSLLFQSISHSLDANVVFIAQIWYDFFCEVLWRDVLKTDFLEHTFCFTFSVKFNLKRNFLCYGCFNWMQMFSTLLLYPHFTLSLPRSGIRHKMPLHTHFDMVAPRLSRRDEPNRTLLTATRPSKIDRAMIELSCPFGITHCFPQELRWCYLSHMKRASLT